MGVNAGYSYRERVHGRVDTRVLDYLARAHRHSSASDWRARIAGGEVEIDGVRADVGTVARPGQWLVWHRPPWHEPEVDGSPDLVFEDEALVAVVKPRGLPTMPGGGFLQQTLLARVRARWPEANPMHRLGRATSGLVLFARTPAAGAALQAAWRRHEVTKIYRALATGVSDAGAYDVSAPIGPVPHPLLGTVHAATVDGKPSRSHARVLERRLASTLFEVAIDTGRPHQIRIHLAFVGHPLVGDPLFTAGGGLRDDALPGDGGYLLHAERLGFVHPVSGRAMALRAIPPTPLRTASEGADPF